MNNIAFERLTGFPRALRQAGLSVDPTSTLNFLTAVTRIGLNGQDDLRRAGRVTLTSSPEQFPAFDAVFDAWFALQDTPGLAFNDDGADDTHHPSPKSARSGAPDFVPGDAAGQDASADELVARKVFSGIGPEDKVILDAIRRVPLPLVTARRWSSASGGSRIDVARTMAEARRTFGETLRMSHLERPSKPRNILLLIDVSGSMKVHSEVYLRAAQALTQTGHGVETFCFSTRLTRATAALRHRNADNALQRLSGAAFGFDGGTRIGESMQEFLSISRYTALVSGAITVVLSDGLECGSPDTIADAAGRLARLSHRLVWLTPLARDPNYLPVTRAMTAILPHLDCLAEASDLHSLHRALSRLVDIERAPRCQVVRAWQGKRKLA